MINKAIINKIEKVARVMAVTLMMSSTILLLLIVFGVYVNFLLLLKMLVCAAVFIWIGLITLIFDE
jgi:uncharacterized membrane protein